MPSSSASAGSLTTVMAGEARGMWTMSVSELGCLQEQNKTSSRAPAQPHENSCRLEPLEPSHHVVVLIPHSILVRTGRSTRTLALGIEWKRGGQDTKWLARSGAGVADIESWVCMTTVEDGLQVFLGISSCQVEPGSLWWHE